MLHLIKFCRPVNNTQEMHKHDYYRPLQLLEKIFKKLLDYTKTAGINEFTNPAEENVENRMTVSKIRFVDVEFSSAYRTVLELWLAGIHFSHLCLRHIIIIIIIIEIVHGVHI